MLCYWLIDQLLCGYIRTMPLGSYILLGGYVLLGGYILLLGGYIFLSAYILSMLLGGYILLAVYILSMLTCWRLTLDCDEGPAGLEMEQARRAAAEINQRALQWLQHATLTQSTCGKRQATGQVALANGECHSQATRLNGTSQVTEPSQATRPGSQHPSRQESLSKLQAASGGLVLSSQALAAGLTVTQSVTNPLAADSAAAPAAVSAIGVGVTTHVGAGGWGGSGATAVVIGAAPTTTGHAGGGGLFASGEEQRRELERLREEARSQLRELRRAANKAAGRLTANRHPPLPAPVVPAALEASAASHVPLGRRGGCDMVTLPLTSSQPVLLDASTTPGSQLRSAACKPACAPQLGSHLGATEVEREDAGLQESLRYSGVKQVVEVGMGKGGDGEKQSQRGYVQVGTGKGKAKGGMAASASFGLKSELACAAPGPLSITAHLSTSRPSSPGVDVTRADCHSHHGILEKVGSARQGIDTCSLVEAPKRCDPRSDPPVDRTHTAALSLQVIRYAPCSAWTMSIVHTESRCLDLPHPHSALIDTTRETRRVLDFFTRPCRQLNRPCSAFGSCGSGPSVIWLRGGSWTRCGTR